MHAQAHATLSLLPRVLERLFEFYAALSLLLPWWGAFTSPYKMMPVQALKMMRTMDEGTMISMLESSGMVK